MSVNQRSSLKHPKGLWTIDEVRAGFLYYHQLFSRYPTAHEIDAFEYLPSSRSLQRSFGGLVDIRRKLNLPIENYTKGESRSVKAKEADERARIYEEEFFLFLTNHFQEIAIHEQKVIRPGNVRSDYFIYLKSNTGVIIDVFYANSLRNMSNIISIKLKTYVKLKQQVYFVLVGNPNISNDDVMKQTLNRVNPLPSNIQVVTEKYFKSDITPLLKQHSNFAL